KGVLLDVGGPTANMYGFECERKYRRGACQHRRCVYPQVCEHLPVDHSPQVALLEALRRLPRIRKVFVASGLRYDLVMADHRCRRAYIDALAQWHVSGQLKIAPEHSEPEVLARMGKSGIEDLMPFRTQFLRASRAAGKEQYLTYYFMAAHPGTISDQMQRLGVFCRGRLKIAPEQVQIFTPSPSTYSTLMYWTGRDPFSGEKIFVERNPHRKQRQKNALRPSDPGRKRRLRSHRPGQRESARIRRRAP
ncbi:MAG: DUF3362 domain-containing protein, partial [Desulfobacterales bacterium]|nr:DUF3362 domain-containing protein [Desulfobacterales bacterium]